MELGLTIKATRRRSRVGGGVADSICVGIVRLLGDRDV